jgi:hypothetical protein
VITPWLEPVGLNRLPTASPVRELQGILWTPATQSARREAVGFSDGVAARCPRILQIYENVAWRFKCLLIKQRGRNLRAGQVGRRTEAWFHDQATHQPVGIIRRPKTA